MPPWPLFAQAPAPPAGPPDPGPMPWVVAFLAVVVILLIVCMPSRKA